MSFMLTPSIDIALSQHAYAPRSTVPWRPDACRAAIRAIATVRRATPLGSFPNGGAQA
jgi:hypothetical protein